MKTSNLTNTFDIITSALSLADTVKDGYVYASTASSLAWSYIRNTLTIQDLAGRRKLSPKQEDLYTNLQRDINDVESLLRWAHNESILNRGGDEPNYSRTVENLAGYKSKDEFRAEAETMYAVIPEAKRIKAVNAYVEGMHAKSLALCEDYEQMIERVTSTTSTEGFGEPNWYLTRFIVNGIQRNLADYTSVEGIENVAQRVGFDAPTKTQHMMAIPLAEYAEEEIDAMLNRISEHLDLANGESGDENEIH